ncbi:TetR/AcrR family transcriptional regulator [Saccharothrix coeruleofusca]|uniref:TetR family transcriptional regulator n=1 Tax=Saccharothrix coeruleofusca TaxID=33919 RepID=A0A918AIV2_9PSEU|nr:TetR family transcriptional regulator [Saccharothrix coeruleofusca]MBP2339995.1 AcrR family transcriptional regulator [Saccharothrix coeruleofusca]GGP38089.1 TetR family transcriptional regulator [Saccharothrix coeruleofusca]
MTSTTPLRRQPVQQRSAKRVERMLEACASLIEEVGYDGVTTTLIAERAGVAVGSLYQFFPDKRAVVQALTMRNLEKFIQTVDERFTSTALEHWWDGVDTIFDVYVSMHREVPAFSKLHFGDVVDLRLLDDQRDNDAVISERIAEMIATKFQIPLADLRLPISVAVAAADGVLNLAFSSEQAGDQQIIDDAKTMIRGYLSAKLP